MKKRISLFFLGLVSILAVSVNAAGFAANVEGEPIVCEQTVPCNPDTLCGPNTCPVTPCNTDTVCNPAPCNPAPCNPGC